MPRFSGDVEEMAPLTTPVRLLESTGAAAEFREPQWYAVYTRARHEKRVAEQLASRRVENLLPLYNSVRRWNDRRVMLQLPLFPGYVFVRMALRDQLQVLELPGVVRLVGFGGNPCPLPVDDIEGLRHALAQDVRAVPHPFLMAGRRIQVRSGPLQGLAGFVVRRKGAYRIVVSIELISRSILVDMDLADLEVSPADLTWSTIR